MWPGPVVVALEAETSTHIRGNYNVTVDDAEEELL